MQLHFWSLILRWNTSYNTEYREVINQYNTLFPIGSIVIVSSNRSTLSWLIELWFVWRYYKLLFPDSALSKIHSPANIIGQWIILISLSHSYVKGFCKLLTCTLGHFFYSRYFLATDYRIFQKNTNYSKMQVSVLIAGDVFR